MSKRFIDTGMFSDSWFCELSANAKLFYIYLITKCDHAGIIDLNIKLAEFETGIKQLAKSYQTVSKELGNRLLRVKDNYYILPKFLKFQYPKGLNTNVKAQLGVINRLNEFGLDLNSLETLSKDLSNSYLTVQDKDKDKDKEQDIKEGLLGEGDKEIFDTFRKEYPGTKRGLETEFSNFQKKHKDWREVLPDLSALLKCQINQRECLKQSDQFVPEWKHLQTWINSRCWEEEFQSQPKQGYRL